MSALVVAKLALPIPISGLDRLVAGLESVYGTGLVVDGAHPDADRWLVVTNPNVQELDS